MRHIRRATPEDADAIAALSAMQTAGTGATTPPPPSNNLVKPKTPIY